jgi:hypothetical protein
MVKSMNKTKIFVWLIASFLIADIFAQCRVTFGFFFPRELCGDNSEDPELDHDKLPALMQRI